MGSSWVRSILRFRFVDFFELKLICVFIVVWNENVPILNISKFLNNNRCELKMCGHQIPFDLERFEMIEQISLTIQFSFCMQCVRFIWKRV